MHIKRLYSYLIKSYLGTFFATFLVCLFVVLMQFLWKYVDEMVGKGLEVSVLLEFFFYAALSLFSMALPLAILLSSLITFGNMGENLELLAMKAAGISLFRIMRPYLVFLSIISVGAFFYSNMAMPVIQTKLWTLLYSMRQKSPEVEIPEGSFYNGIDGYHIFVKEKDKKTKLLKNMMIYDFSKGFDNSVVMAADSARLKVASDKQSLILELYDGESFENLKKQGGATRNVPYRRETFSYKEVLIEFDANFNKMDESVLSNRYMGKNLNELTVFIDSMQLHSDSISQKEYGLYQRHFFERGATGMNTLEGSKKDTTKTAKIVANDSTKKMPVDYTLKELLSQYPLSVQVNILERAIKSSDRMRMDLPFIHGQKEGDTRRIHRFDIERHRKFTLSFACVLFFLIGAPLGAIIRKGGLGLPVVVSVILFIIYYIIDNTGYKMAREGVWYVWQGIWLSSFVLFPLGAFLTYMAATDRTVELKSPKVLWKQFKEFLVRVRAKLQKKFYKAQPIEAGNEVDNKVDNKSEENS